jgi:hypothetical protein
MENPVEGLISQMLKGTALNGIGVMPKLEERDLTIEITEQQFKDLIFANLKPEDKARVSSAVQIKILDGKVVLKIRLF